ncbi:trafficking protein particle complex subunit 10 [Echinococcus multilocularis]|uniref:Trafficking protein particle complex subunit 10 n=1 Tax=Echinococcus multilocularis TaxID=6211 RepID=A0A068Y9E5_ECHMU|nr:trafficking protein particle complex subunit 10 [Echinococcus multilocularis]
MDVDSRPIIYYYGDEAAKYHVQEFRSSGLAAQPVQWSRHPDQPSQSVHVDPNFLPLHLPTDVNNGLGSQSAYPAIYIFFCPNDPQYYANRGKKTFGKWFGFLSSNKLKEWLIITITDKSKKISSRNSVATQLKHDFSIDFTDRLHDLPSDYESYPGTLQALNVKLRNAVIRVFNTTLDAIDNRAEKLAASRNDEDWDFMDYLLCMEEIASLYSCMSLYEEALECMEKAENCLSVALANAAGNGVNRWVRNLLSNSYENLLADPTIVSTYASPQRVERVRRREANLFELRAHILTRECALLQALDRITELPALAVRNIRLCTKEVRDLKVMVPALQLYFWTFLSTLQTLEIFRLGTPCVPKTEDFIHLRRKFLHANNLLQHPLSTTTTPAAANPAIALSTDEDSNCPSNASELSASTLISARFKAMESLDLLEDVSFQTEGTFNVLARAVLASVVADDHARSGRTNLQSQALVGTSQWTVDLWRRACVALARLGRCTDLWPDPARCTQNACSDSLQDSMLLSIIDSLNNFTSRNRSTPDSTRFSFGGSFGAQLSIAFVSPESFQEVYRKFVGACIFFQSCSGEKRSSNCMSLELADFYRDAGKFLKAESLYHRATKIFLRESWTELATYSLLQQAFCQQVQWRTENVDTIEASVFRRYVQTALILAITPTKSLHQCYDLLKRRGSYFDNLFGEGITAARGAAAAEVAILPPWWPDDWWAHSLETVSEHYARIAPPPPLVETLSLHRPLMPLAVRSLWPLFRLLSVDLEEANPHTHRQVIRLHLRLTGVRQMLLRVSVGARPTTSEDWSMPPLLREVDKKHGSDPVKFFNVDFSSEGVRVGIISSTADASSAASAEFGGGGDGDSSTSSPSVAVAATTPALLSSSTSKESVMQRLFRRTSAKGRPGRILFKRSSDNARTTNGQSADVKPPKRPTSIDFLGYRGRLNTLDRVNPLPYDSILDGLTLSSDYDRFVPSATGTPETVSMTEDSVFSDSRAARHHKKGFSLSDLSSFMHSLKILKNDVSSRNHVDTNGTPMPPVTTKAVVIEKNDVFFYTRNHATNLFHCRLQESAKEPIEDKDNVLVFQPGDNYLIMETAHYGFHLPGEISIAVYNDLQSAENNSPIFIFSSPISPEQHGSTWSNETLLERLLPRVEQIEALRVSKAYSFPEPPKKASALVMNDMSQPVFLTVRVGALSIEQQEGGSGVDSAIRLRLHRHPHAGAPQEGAWGQNYSVEPSGEGEVEKTVAWSDLGDLVVAPGEIPPPSPLLYIPGTRLCPRCSFLLRPKPNERITLILPTGRPYPINLIPVGALIFKARVFSFQSKHFVVQLQVEVRDTTWPVLGSVDNKGSPHLNPFYCQERITFKLSAPEMVIKSFNDAPSQLPPQSQQPPSLPPSLRGSFVPGPQRSISVVEFAPPSPAVAVTGASAALHHSLLPHSREVGYSVFFPPKAAERTVELNAFASSGASVSGESGSTQDSSSNFQNPIQLIEPLDLEWIVSYGRPLTVSWTVQMDYLNRLLRPLPKSDKIGVLADFSFLAGTNFDEARPRLRYSCNLVKKH